MEGAEHLHARILTALDLDGDGRVTLDEFASAFQEMKSLMERAARAGVSGGLQFLRQRMFTMRTPNNKGGWRHTFRQSMLAAAVADSPRGTADIPLVVKFRSSKGRGSAALTMAGLPTVDGWQRRGELQRKYFDTFFDYPPRLRRIRRRLTRIHTQQTGGAAAFSTQGAGAATASFAPYKMVTFEELQKGDADAKQRLAKQMQELADCATETKSDDVHVFVRVRGDEPPGVIDVHGSTLQLRSTLAGVPSQQFRFDGVLQKQSSNKAVYERIGLHAVKQAIRGISTVVLAYGQTGSGKTHTLLGSSADNCGMAKLIIHDFVEGVKSSRAAEEGDLVEYVFECTAAQVYQGNVYDLLGEKREVTYRRLPTADKSSWCCADWEEALPSGTQEAAEVVTRVFDPARTPVRLVSRVVERSVVDTGGLTTETSPPLLPVKGESADELHRLLERGLAVRRTRSTAMNDASSRSHCVITITATRRQVVVVYAWNACMLLAMFYQSVVGILYQQKHLALTT